MKKKNIAAVIGGTIAAAGALALGAVSSPSGQQVIETSVQQNVQHNAGQRAAQQQQLQSNHQRVIVNPGTQIYLPAGGKYGTALKSDAVSPKEYGEWLLRSGKNKYNQRKAQHIRKARA